MKILKMCLGALMAVGMVSCQENKFPDMKEIELGNAQVSKSGDSFTVTTGKVSRTWTLDEGGLHTSSFTNTAGTELIAEHNGSDWSLPLSSQGETPVLVSSSNAISNDEGFAQEFILTSLEFEYPQSGLGLKYNIWTWPNAEGFRTQISLKTLSDSIEVSEFAEGILSELSLQNTDTYFTAGYYNDTQHRNSADKPILKEESGELYANNQINDWASVLALHNETEGLILVKESHKCVNQKGVNTGGFSYSNKGIAVYGTGLDAAHINGEYQKCWATWSIPFSGSKEDMELALKKFDRTRFPVREERDIYIMSNTWGSSQGPVNGRYASREENILREIASAKDLGIDLLQIDDGWQGQNYKQWRPLPSAEYNGMKNTKQELPKGTEYDIYPNGWSTVVNSAADSGVQLGLWAAWWIPYEDLVWNQQDAGFKSFKLDFSNLKDYKTLQEFMGKMRSFVLTTKHKARVNWDVTENQPRIGYYFGREFGNIYLENRKPSQPANVLYHPWLVLRDAWHVAHYTNINKFQVSVQNLDRVEESSDAGLYNHPYAVNIALMGSPIFFQETQYYDDAAREAIRPVIKAYKNIRNDYYKGYVFAIGEEPTNASWSAFQNVSEDKNTGFLTVFRERLNEEQQKSIQLKFLRDCQLELNNIYTGETQTAQVDKDGFISLEIQDATDVRFWSYKVI